MTDQTTISQTYRVCSDPVNDIWRKYSFWGMAEDVMLAEGVDLQTKIDSLKDGVDTISQEVTDIPIKGEATHERLKKRFEDMEQRYKDKIQELEDLISNLSPDNATIPGWDLLVDMLNLLIAETTELTEDMLRDLSYFNPGDLSTDITLSQSNYDYLNQQIQQLAQDEQNDINEIYNKIGDMSALNYMLNDGTQTTDTRLAPLILKHQAVLQQLHAMAVPLAWEEISAVNAVQPSSNISSVTGSLRYQKDTGICMSQITFNFNGTLQAGQEMHLGTLNVAYCPEPICGDVNLFNTTFVVLVRKHTSTPDVYGSIRDNGSIWLYNRGTTPFSGNITMATTYCGKIVQGG